MSADIRFLEFLASVGLFVISAGILLVIKVLEEIHRDILKRG